MDEYDTALKANPVELARENERLRTAVADAKKMAHEIAQHDEEGYYTLAHRADRAAELAHSWLVRHGV